MLSRLEAYVIALCSMILWGIYPNIVKLSKAPWREHFRVQSFATLLVLVAGASSCDCFFLNTKDYGLLLLAMASGGVCGLGVLSQVAAIILEGVVISIPISNGLGTVLGTIILYCIEIGKHATSPYALFAGVFFIFVAICLNAFSSTFSTNNLTDRINTNQTLGDRTHSTPLLEPPKKNSSSADFNNRRIFMRPGIVFAIGAGLCFAAWPVLEDITILDFKANLFADVLAPFAFGFFFFSKLYSFLFNRFRKRRICGCS